MRSSSTCRLTRRPRDSKKTAAGVLPTGQGVGVIDELPSVEELMARIIAEAEEALGRLGVPAPLEISA